MNDLLKNAPEIKEKAFSIIDENCSKNIKVPDFLCCKITYVSNLFFFLIMIIN